MVSHGDGIDFYHLANSGERGPEAVKGYLRRLVSRGLLSRVMEGNYSVTVMGEDFNYRLKGKELFFTDKRDAINCAHAIKYKTKSKHPAYILKNEQFKTGHHIN